MNQGWVKIHRSVRDHPRYGDEKWSRVFLELVLMAAHRPRRVTFMGKVITLRPGQLITSLPEIRNKLNIHDSSVRRILETLKTDRQIFWESGNKNRLITIVNWEKLQESERHKCAKSTDSRQTTDRQPTDHPVVIKNDKNEKNTDKTLGVISVQPGQPNLEVSKSLAENYQYQKQHPVAKDHVKWPEFAAWCRSKLDKHGQPGVPTEKGFWKWLCGQKSQWRNEVKERFEENGYVFDGKWLTAQEANHLGREKPQLITKLRPAVKRGGKIIVSENSITGTKANPQVDLLGVPMAQEEKEKRLGFVPIKELVAEVRKVFSNAQLLSKVSAPK